MYNIHKNGVPICTVMKDLTLTQRYWLSLMSVEDINFENKFISKFDALCKANGVKIDSNINSGRGGSSFRDEMLRKQRERKERKVE